MIKTNIIGTIIAIILAIAAFFILFTQNPDSNVPQVPVPSNNLVLDACALFSEPDAKLLFGSTSQKSDSPTDLTIGKTKVSHCTYDTPAGTAAVVIRQAKSTGNAKYIFENSKMSNKGVAQDVPVGDSAYWVPALSQYNVLKDDTWIITTSQDNKEAAERMATTIVENL